AMTWRRLPAALILGVLLLLTTISRPPARAAETGTPLQLSVTLHGQPTGLIGEFLQRGEALFVRPEEWEALGLRATAAAAEDGLLALSAMTPLAWRLDTATQTLHLTAPAALLQPQILMPPALRASRAEVESGTGITANYD